MRKTIKRTSVIGLTLGVTMTAGIAIAAWTASGTGSGNSEAISANEVETVASTTTAQLYPGGTGDLVVTVVNDNPFPVEVTKIEGNGAITSDKGAACDASTGVTFTDDTSLTEAVVANSTGTVITLVGAVAMSNASDTTCQGAVFTVPVSITAASDAP